LVAKSVHHSRDLSLAGGSKHPRLNLRCQKLGVEATQLYPGRKERTRSALPFREAFKLLD
jgi:hypothetical protein